MMFDIQRTYPIIDGIFVNKKTSCIFKLYVCDTLLDQVRADETDYFGDGKWFQLPFFGKQKMNFLPYMVPFMDVYVTCDEKVDFFVLGNYIGKEMVKTTIKTTIRHPVVTCGRFNVLCYEHGLVTPMFAVDSQYIVAKID